MVLASTRRFGPNSFQSIETPIPRGGPDPTGEISATILDGYDHDRGSGLATQASTETGLEDGSSQSVWTVGMTLSFGDGFQIRYGHQQCPMS
jgi:hypothetical protein